MTFQPTPNCTKSPFPRGAASRPRDRKTVDKLIFLLMHIISSLIYYQFPPTFIVPWGDFDAWTALGRASNSTESIAKGRLALSTRRTAIGCNLIELMV